VVKKLKYLHCVQGHSLQEHQHSPCPVVASFQSEAAQSCALVTVHQYCLLMILEKLNLTLTSFGKANASHIRSMIFDNKAL
jgi:hypothetical protein